MSYTPTNWNSGDVITAEKLNNIESGIEGAVFGEPIVLVDTTTLTFAKDGDNVWYCTGENPLPNFTRADFLPNRLYVVNWDDDVYEVFCTSQSEVISTSGNEWNSIGNLSILNFSNWFVSDAPFIISYDFGKSASIKVYTLDTSVTHTIKIVAVPYTLVNRFPFYNNLSDDGQPIIRKGIAPYSVVESYGSYASGNSSHCEGNSTISSGNYSHCEGSTNIASGTSSHCEGAHNVASGNFAHAEGYGNVASGAGSHADGVESTANGDRGHTEGYQTTASGTVSHAKGFQTTASGHSSYSEGFQTTASGNISHSQGECTVANHRSQFVFGAYNVADPSAEAANVRGNYVEIVGNGTAEDARSNARTLDWNGNEALAGGLTLGKGTADEVTITATQLSALLALLNQ